MTTNTQNEDLKKEINEIKNSLYEDETSDAGDSEEATSTEINSSK